MKAPPEPPREIALPALTPFADAALEKRGDYDAVSFEELDLSHQDAGNATFLDCAIVRCRADGLQLRRARVVASLVTDLRAVSIDAAESSWRDVLLGGGRIGAAIATAAHLARVRVRGVKLDYVNARGAELQDVVFERCVVGEIDFAEAELTNVSFVDTRLDSLNVAGAALDRLDLSGAALRQLSGLDSLRGAIVSPVQLHDLAPLLAEHLGITVAGDAVGGGAESGAGIAVGGDAGG